VNHRKRQRDFKDAEGRLSMSERPGLELPLPRLLYLADVPVEASYHGSALIYRLLQSYPSESLLVVEQSFQKSQLSRRLAKVRYEELPTRSGRLLGTRIAKIAASWLTLTAPLQERLIPSFLGTFQPQAVLTVLEGFSWLPAASFALRKGLPLHVIVHDDWPQRAPLRPPVTQWMKLRYGHVYRAARSRLCVSPAMIAEYRRRYGVDGTLLYPSRAASTPHFEVWPDRQGVDQPFTVAYAGSLNVGDYVRQLVAISWMLPKFGGKLLLFGPFSKESIETRGINLEVVEHGGLIDSAELVLQLRQRADVLFVPESFEDRSGMKLSFPSKLTDYTAAAIPLLIWGPIDSAAVKWAASEPGVAALVTDRNDEAIAQILQRLSLEKDWRRSLGNAAGVVGSKYFSPAHAISILHDALSTGPV
jgi:glycosyltransferase involved in cell wall biosynthesis